MQDQTVLLTRQFLNNILLLCDLIYVNCPRQKCTCSITFYCELISAPRNECLKPTGQNKETMTYSECLHCYQNFMLPKCYNNIVERIHTLTCAMHAAVYGIWFHAHMYDHMHACTVLDAQLQSCK